MNELGNKAVVDFLAVIKGLEVEEQNAALRRVYQEMERYREEELNEMKLLLAKAKQAHLYIKERSYIVGR